MLRRCHHSVVVVARGLIHGAAALHRQPSPTPGLCTVRALGTLLVQPKHRGEDDRQEACRLVEAFIGSGVYQSLVVGSKNFKPNPAGYFGKGNLETIRQQCLAMGAERVVVNAILTGAQERVLQQKLQVPLLDRVGLIIAIFAQRAKTQEARVQVELAQLQHQLSRLVRVRTKSGRGGFGEGDASEVVSARQRGRSGAGGLGGGGGSGDSELSMQRSRIQARIKSLEKMVEDVRRTRAQQRKGRRAAGLPVVAVVGYTNVGKSALVSALSKTSVHVEDKLFATLDPTLRKVHLAEGRSCCLSDTVGFIKGLPVKLVQAFHATLEEVVEADVLLHMLDVASPTVAEQRAAVIKVLLDIGVSKQQLADRMIEVWNKSDLLLPDTPDTGQTTNGCQTTGNRSPSSTKSSTPSAPAARDCSSTVSGTHTHAPSARGCSSTVSSTRVHAPAVGDCSSSVTSTHTHAPSARGCCSAVSNTRTHAPAIGDCSSTVTDTHSCVSAAGSHHFTASNTPCNTFTSASHHHRPSTTLPGACGTGSHSYNICITSVHAAGAGHHMDSVLATHPNAPGTCTQCQASRCSCFVSTHRPSPSKCIGAARVCNPHAGTALDTTGTHDVLLPENRSAPCSDPNLANVDVMMSCSHQPQLIHHVPTAHHPDHTVSWTEGYGWDAVQHIYNHNHPPRPTTLVSRQYQDVAAEAEVVGSNLACLPDVCSRTTEACLTPHSDSWTPTWYQAVLIAWTQQRTESLLSCLKPLSGGQCGAGLSIARQVVVNAKAHFTTGASPCETSPSEDPASPSSSPNSGGNSGASTVRPKLCNSREPSGVRSLAAPITKSFLHAHTRETLQESECVKRAWKIVKNVYTHQQADLPIPRRAVVVSVARGWGLAGVRQALDELAWRYTRS